MFKWQWLKKIHKLFQPISIKLPTIIVIIHIVGISADQDLIFRDINQHCISGMGSIHMDQMCGDTAQVQFHLRVKEDICQPRFSLRYIRIDNVQLFISELDALTAV